MKQCPQCRQTFSDETHFCLSDGTPLIALEEPPEEETVISTGGKNDGAAGPAPPTGFSPILLYLAGGAVLLFLAVVVIGITLFVLSRNWKTEPSNTPQTISNQTDNDNGMSQLNKEKANLQAQQEQLEKEKQRLAEERKKLNEEKNKPTATPSSISTPLPGTPYPAQPTARIKFGRGRVAESVSGKIFTERSFVLQARSGQYLSAVVGGPGCVTFSNGSKNLGFVTANGDNRLTLVNNCGSEASFNLTVSIK